jgi:uncharacterized integral membrane protein
MRYLGWFLKLALFVAIFSVSVKNTDPVAIRWYLGIEWRAPLIFALLVAFCAGVALGVAACLGQLFRLRREIAALKRAPDAPGQEPRRIENELQV